jgi:hypothetical protein
VYSRTTSDAIWHCRTTTFFWTPVLSIANGVFDPYTTCISRQCRGEVLLCVFFGTCTALRCKANERWTQVPALAHELTSTSYQLHRSLYLDSLGF